LLHQRPAEIVDEEEDGEKANKEAEQKEFSGMNDEVEGEEGREAASVPEQVEAIQNHSEEKEGPARVNGGTDEENGEELDQVNNELQPTVDEERKSQGSDNVQDEVFLFFCLLICVHKCVCVCAHACAHMLTLEGL
jgi:hypothetical protein